MKYAVRDEEAQSDACSAKARPRAAEGRRLIAMTSLKPPHDVSREGERCRHRMRRIQSSHRGARMLVIRSIAVASSCGIHGKILLAFYPPFSFAAPTGRSICGPAGEGEPSRGL